MNDCANWVEGIYAAGMGEVSWAAAVRPISAHFCCECFGLVVRDHSHRIPVARVLNGDLSESEQARREQYADTDPTPSYVMSRPSGSVVTPGQLGQRQHYESTVYYNEWAAPNGLERCAIGWAALSHERFLAFGAHRRRARGSFSPAEVALLECLMPHFVRAVRIADDRERARVIAHAVDVELMRQGCAAILVDRDLVVDWTSDSTGQILSDATGITIEGGLLRISHGRRGELQRLVRRACDTGASATYRCSSHHIEVARVAEQTLLRRARCMVVVTEVPRRSAPDDQWLCAAFQLTAAEARVAMLLARGLSVSAIAEQRGVSNGTVRNQLKQVFGKLGVSSQSEVVRIVSRVPPLRDPAK